MVLNVKRTDSNLPNKCFFQCGKLQVPFFFLGELQIVSPPPRATCQSGPPVFMTALISRRFFSPLFLSSTLWQFASPSLHRSHFPPSIFVSTVLRVSFPPFSPSAGVWGTDAAAGGRRALPTSGAGVVLVSLICLRPADDLAASCSRREWPGAPEGGLACSSHVKETILSLLSENIPSLLTVNHCGIHTETCLAFERRSTSRSCGGYSQRPTNNPAISLVVFKLCRTPLVPGEWRGISSRSCQIN